MEEKKKRGRPVTGDPKNKHISFRATDQVDEMLKSICKKQGCSVSDALEKMIRIQYNLTKSDVELL